MIYTEVLGNPYIKQHKKPKNLSEIMEFPNDSKIKVKEFTKEEIEKMRKAWRM